MMAPAWLPWAACHIDITDILFRQALQSRTEPNSEYKYMRSVTSEYTWERLDALEVERSTVAVVRNDPGAALASDVDLVMSGNLCQDYVDFACLKPKFIWVYLESLLIYLVLSETGIKIHH